MGDLSIEENMMIARAKERHNQYIISRQWDYQNTMDINYPAMQILKTKLERELSRPVSLSEVREYGIKHGVIKGSSYDQF